MAKTTIDQHEEYLKARGLAPAPSLLGPIAAVLFTCGSGEEEIRIAEAVRLARKIRDAAEAEPISEPQPIEDVKA